MEENEFEHIAERLRPIAEGVARRFFGALGIAEEADDVTQDVMLRLWQSRQTFGEISNPEAWICRVTKNRCVSRYREMKRIETRQIDDYDFEGGSRATESIDNEEQKSLAAELLGTLPRQTRLILYMRNAEGMTLDEIAIVTGRPKTSIKSSITTAKANILKQLKRKR